MTATPSICPNCGEAVPSRAAACPRCGSDESTGWSPAARYAHLMPEDGPAPRRGRRATLATGVIAVVVVVALLAGLAGPRDPYWLAAAAALLVVVLLLGRPTRTMAAAAAPEGLQRLIALCYGDREMAERLIAGEQRRSPGLGRRALIARAIERLRDDRRR